MDRGAVVVVGSRAGEATVRCPICENKPANRDCTEREVELHFLREDVSKLLLRLESEMEVAKETTAEITEAVDGDGDGD